MGGRGEDRALEQTLGELEGEGLGTDGGSVRKTEQSSSG